MDKYNSPTQQKMSFENWEPQGPSKNETRIAIAIVGILALVIPITIVGGFIHYRNAGKSLRQIL